MLRTDAYAARRGQRQKIVRAKTRHKTAPCMNWSRVSNITTRGRDIPMHKPSLLEFGGVKVPCFAWTTERPRCEILCAPASRRSPVLPLWAHTVRSSCSHTEPTATPRVLPLHHHPHQNTGRESASRNRIRRHERAPLVIPQPWHCRTSRSGASAPTSSAASPTTTR